MFSQVKEMSQNTQMKRTAEEAQLSTEAVTAPAKKPKATRAKGPWMPVEFDANGGNALSIVVEKDRAGELIPKAKVAGQEESTFVAQFNTPAMTVQFNDLKQGGDTGKFGKDETNYKYNVKCVKGLPDKVAAAMPNEEVRQEAFMKWAENTCDALLTKAFETKGCMESHKKKAAKAAKKNKTEPLQEFLNGATKSMLKEYTDQDGDDHPMFVSGRRGQYKNEQGEYTDNRPVFWKRTQSGWEKVEVQYISQGSVVKYQVGFRAYATPNMYGVSCDLGKNIVVVFKVNKPTQQTSSEPIVPYIEF